MPRPRILVVDDKRANLIALEAVLGADYELVFASSGAEALALVDARQDLALILMDVQMPDLDGFETAERIKRMERARDIPIIFVTAIYTEDPYIRKGYEVGGIDYFSKPFDPEVLKMKVAVYASFRQKAQFLRERELHLRESEELLRVGRKLSSMLESLPVGVLIADAQGRIGQATDEAARILNVAEVPDVDAYGEILGWWDSAGRLVKQGPLARAVHEGVSSHSERLEIRQFNGGRKAIVVSASPLRGLEGRVLGAVVLLQDLTETQAIEQDLERRVTNLVALGVELEEATAR